MPFLTLENIGTIEVPANKRLVNALVDDCGQDQLHACGGVGKCTTCRIEVISGAASPMTVAEYNVLSAKGLIANSGARLSCQMTCVGDLALRVISRFAGSGRKDAGGRPKDDIEPPTGICRGLILAG